MSSSKPNKAERERGATAKPPARSSAPSRSHVRPSVAPAPARTSHALPAGNALARETLPTLPKLASALAQSPVTFVTEPAALAVIASSPAAHPAEKHGHPTVGVRQKFGELREALADGWEIVQPIFARPLWSVSDDSITAFNFVLRRDCTTRLVTVPAGRTVQRFIRDRQLIVDYRN
ncbi:MAG TPA: hypothetical protein VF116_05725 [Ktedonobacterales bacterium]